MMANYTMTIEEMMNNKLTKNKKQEDVYKLVIKDTKNIKKDSQLVIEIDSSKGQCKLTVFSLNDMLSSMRIGGG